MSFFASKRVRQANELSKHVRKILGAQRDILAPGAVAAVEKSLGELKDAIEARRTDNEIADRVTNLEDVAGKWLKPYPHAGIRENVEVLLVALSIAMAIRTFFVQPFKIPTGSMQPTLFGVTAENLRSHPDIKIPSPAMRVFEACVYGYFYHYQEAEADGKVVEVDPPENFLRFFKQVQIKVQYAGTSEPTPYTFRMVDDHFIENAGLQEGERFRKGYPIVKMLEIAGDHLFVDRLTYNFRRPDRGEIIVFETKNIGNEIAHLPPDQFYIKRMVAKGGDSVSIGDDRHLVINGARLDKDTPHFENVYSFDTNRAPSDCHSPLDVHYSGHLNGHIAGQVEQLRNFNIAPLFPNQDTVYHVEPEHYMVMGDNTANSFDSRAWGEFSRTNVIGRYCFVYWPFSPRFGWSVK